MKEKMTRAEYARHLEGTLIPDLRKFADHAESEDHRQFCDWMADEFTDALAFVKNPELKEKDIPWEDE